MNPMKPILYRVETYIVPEVNRAPGFSLENAINEIDDLKATNKLKDREDENVSENTAQSRKNTSSSHNKFIQSKIYSLEQPINDNNENKLIKRPTDITQTNEDETDRQFNNNNYEYNDTNSDVHIYYAKEFQPSIESQDILYPVRQFKKVNSLMSIDERSEISLESKISDCCHHGFKNGCTATIPSPEVISDDIFKENWLQKMEILRERDAILKEKEMNLQIKERELFRREKELRIGERILNEKLKLVDQQLQYQRDVQLVEEKLEKAARILFQEVEEPEEPVKAEKLRVHQSPEKTLTLVPETIINPHEKNEETDQKIKHPTHPKNNPSKPSTKLSSLSNTFSRTHSYASVRYKRPPRTKIRYDDLNSTLSADNGDSSFVQTSKFFNPHLYKKPDAFTRSASERWPSRTSNTFVTRPQGVVTIEERAEPAIEEEKVFRKFSENIIASHDKDTKFQHYGLVDYKLHCKPDNVQTNATKPNPGPSEKKPFSYLDLATSNKQGQKRTNVSKDRPISWNEKEDEWLQKKRLAYNLAMKTLENLENKEAENKENECNIVAEKGGKSSKKNSKNKLFSIFR
ncbi:LOW QUALITY PROTEIN: general transcriptional corepressor trfA-like [Nylanderia fulva]|uniref:LOW QUALITY PROTEIN: general transcriptional corepressor trfA-like n=1 Tax=Nylanderia fulva TaxID=613905 RepID=UPI0010FBA46F|nr:LOW QUALITY PROTEIN: general transcriptional corepressor trfA-like [Nylanderia fulva]